MKIKACIKSMRLRTLPLSLSGVVMGTALARLYGPLPADTLVFLVSTTLLLQILSNLSNELGDTFSGTDDAARQGIHYAIQDGEMTLAQMKRFIGATAALCCLSGLCMIRCSFGTLWGTGPVLLILLGAAAVAAAIKYTLGHRPYGYRGLGDCFVFVFFGLVSTLGSCFVLCHHTGGLQGLLPACALGFFSMGVLNVNNIRDMQSDARTRTTVAIKLGPVRARVYQTVLITAGWLCMVVFTVWTGKGVTSWLYLVTLPLYHLHLAGVWTRFDKALDPMLPLLVMGTFVMTLLTAIGMYC